MTFFHTEDNLTRMAFANKGASRLAAAIGDGGRWATVVEAAASIGVPDGTVVRWRNGTRIPDARGRLRLWAVLKIPFWAWDEAMPEPATESTGELCVP